MIQKEMIQKEMMQKEMMQKNIKQQPECYLFAGPSLYLSGEMLKVPAGVEVLPPVQRGDISKLCEHLEPGVCAIADGLFHQVLAVGHAEIREAMRSGWSVWGLSSMGAIRAFEMRSLGMHGFGQVYEMFLRCEEDFQDDEVALMHEPEAPYRPLTEPLIHMRVALMDLTARNLLDHGEAETIVADLKSYWYGERTLTLLRERIHRAVLAQRWPRLEQELANFDRWRIKSHDLQRFLSGTTWKYESNE